MIMDLGPVVQKTPEKRKVTTADAVVFSLLVGPAVFVLTRMVILGPAWWMN
jgi:hypothetical protein